MKADRCRRIFFASAALCALALTGAGPVRAQKKDYLTQLEADKIRDAEQTAPKIKLFVEFAADRLKKFQYELSRPTTERMREERLNFLLNAYTGCVDDATDLIELGREKQEDIRAGIKDMQKRVKEFMPTLEKLLQGGQDLPLYKETLLDAIEATKDAQAKADQAAKEIAPAPVRRRP